MYEIIVKSFNYSDLGSADLIDEFEAADVVGLSVPERQAKLLRTVWQKFDSYKITCFKDNKIRCLVERLLWLLCDKYISTRFKWLPNINSLYYSVGKRAFPVQFVKKGASYSVWFCKKQEDDIRRYDVTSYVAKQGAAQAQCSLATLYAEGKGVDQNYKEAFNWFLLSAKNGDLDAQYSLGCLYIKGGWVEKNDHEALYWLRKAANKGHAATIDLLQKMGVSLEA